MSKPKNILYLALSTFSQTGGIEKVNKGWLKALSNMVNEQQIQLRAHILLDETPDERYIGKANFKGFKGNKILFMFAGLFAIFKADTIIVSHINLGLLVVLAKIINPKINIFLHAHGVEVWRILSIVQKIALIKANNILAVSEFTKQELIKRHHIKADKIIVFPNALDPFFEIPKSLEKPASLLERYALSKDQKILFTLARLSSSEQYKGYEQVIQVLPELLKQHPDLIYFIGGKADESEQKKLETLIASLHLEDRVKLLGYITEEELTNHYLLADIFVMPSEGEGFGIAFIEAAACGRPVLAGNTDGSRQAIMEGQTGLLCCPGKESDIIYKISALLNFVTTKMDIQYAALNAYSFDGYKQQIQSFLNKLNSQQEINS